MADDIVELSTRYATSENETKGHDENKLEESKSNLRDVIDDTSATTFIFREKINYKNIELYVS